VTREGEDGAWRRVAEVVVFEAGCSIEHYAWPWRAGVRNVSPVGWVKGPDWIPKNNRERKAGRRSKYNGSRGPRGGWKSDGQASKECGEEESGYRRRVAASGRGRSVTGSARERGREEGDGEARRAEGEGVRGGGGWMTGRG
jgi:hypothetical protein